MLRAITCLLLLRRGLPSNEGRARAAKRHAEKISRIYNRNVSMKSMYGSSRAELYAGAHGGVGRARAQPKVRAICGRVPVTADVERLRAQNRSIVLTIQAFTPTKSNVCEGSEAAREISTPRPREAAGLRPLLDARRGETSSQTEALQARARTGARASRSASRGLPDCPSTRATTTARAPIVPL